MNLVLRNILFTCVIPGLGGVGVPWWILTYGNASPKPLVWEASIVIALGVGLYLSCIWRFATVGQGTPGLWDAPRHLVAVGPYRWVRNPIYLSALLVVIGEAWLFLSRPLLIYAGVMAVFFHLVVIGYEEPTLQRRFGDTYDEYLRTVSRWIPRLPSR